MLISRRKLLQHAAPVLALGRLQTRGAPALKPQRGFWTRGEAYAFAYAAHEQRRWQHYHVFRVTADIEWLQTGDARTGEFDATFGRPRELTNVFVAATEVAALMEAAR